MGYLRRFLRDHRPSPAMVVASIALLVALGGTSVAAVNQLAANSVGTSQLKNNAVTTPKIKNSAVNASKLASNAVATAKIASNAVTNAKIANGTIQPADLSAAAKTVRPARARRGQQGPSGPAGAPAAAAWASVDAERHAGTQQERRVRTEERDRSVPGDLQPGRDGLQLPCRRLADRPPASSSRARVRQPSCRTSLPVYGCSPLNATGAAVHGHSRSSLPSSANVSQARVGSSGSPPGLL